MKLDARSSLLSLRAVVHRQAELPRIMLVHELWTVEIDGPDLFLGTDLAGKFTEDAEFPLLGRRVRPRC